ncbi:MAG: hypothetical protein RL238_1835 [Actinomycetota bacterium]|jgi:hypothetical protein
MTSWRVILAAGLVFSVAACSDDGSSAGDTTVAVESSASETTVAAETTVAETVEPVAPETTAAQEPEWEAVTAPADCMCSDGSGFTYFVRKADPTKVVFYLEGGGACFDAGTCGPDSSAFKRTVGAGPNDRTTGVFDFGDPRNPFDGWSIVYVPYCTGDVHVGNNTMDYGNGIVIEHKGAVNGTAALNAMAERFPDATELVVTGESAGSVPTPMYAGLASDLLPDARITVLADGSGAYPDIPAINAYIGGNWGTLNAVPDWPENEGMTAEQWSFPGLFIQSWKHAPDITFARHDYAFDETQAFFSSLAGIAADDLVSLIDKNEAQIEAAGVDLFSYISPGDSHTVLGKPDFYTDTQNDVAFVDWVTALVAGEPVTDNHCNTTANGCRA